MPADSIFFQGSHLEAGGAVAFIHTAGHCDQQHAHCHDRHSYKYFGAGVAEGFFHEFSGLLIFAICIPVLLIEMKILEKLPPIQSKTTSESKETDTTTSDNNPGSHNKKVSKHGLLLQPMFVVAVILLGATLAISHTVDFREKIPAKKNLEQFPLKDRRMDFRHATTYGTDIYRCPGFE